MREYNCPDCQSTDTCEGCQRLIQSHMLTTVGGVSISTSGTPEVTQIINDIGKTLIASGVWNHQFIPDPCKKCNNNPSNGGSGICHCILGSVTIY